jgi:hypothetical protein
MRLAGHGACMVKINAYMVSVGKAEKEGLLGRPRCMWEVKR